VKTIKSILKKSKDTGENPQSVLYAWRNVPRAHGYSPAQHMFGRQQRLALPQPPVAFSQIDFEKASTAHDKAYSSSEKHYNRDKANLTALQIGQNVSIKDPNTKAWTSQGVVTAIRPDGLSYIIDIQGMQCIRPRHMLKVLQAVKGEVKIKVDSLLEKLTPQEGQRD
jgi:hypothetical protein